MIELSKISNQVGLNFIEEPPLATYRAMVNSCIQDVNALNIKPKELLSIKGVDGTWCETVVDWEDLDELWSELGAFIDGFSYDATGYKLTMPDTIDSLDNIYIADDEWSSDSYENVRGDYPHKNTYCRIGVNIFFSEDISDEDTSIEIIATLNYAELSDSSTEINLRDDFTAYLISAVTAKLSVTQKYRDSDLYAVASREANTKLSKISETEMSKNTPPYINYGKGDGLEYY